MVVGERGPYSLTYQGLLSPTPPDILVGSLNVNGLSQAKLTELLWLVDRTALDVLILVDVHRVAMIQLHRVASDTAFFLC